MTTTFTQQTRTLLRRIQGLLAEAVRQGADQAETVEQARRTQCAVRDGQLLRQVVAANSPHEVDWLLHASILTDVAKRRYCLERALQINPSSDLALAALAGLDEQCAPAFRAATAC